ncbi:MAG: hypothetical protein ACRD9R_20165 [Pyrinomonadaceae bacterium]
MVAKKKQSTETEETKGKVKVGKLKLNKESVKDLTGSQQKQIRGGKGKQIITAGCVTTE